MSLIDVHTHVVPRNFPDGTNGEARWPCMCHGENDTATIMIADKAFRELDHRSWDTATRITDMDRKGIDRQVLSPMPELLSYWFAPQAGLDMCRHVNDTIADMVNAAPERFSGLGIVPLQDPVLAATELSRIREAGLAGVEIGSNINGIVLGDARFEVFYSEATALGLCVFVHALHPVGTERLSRQPDLIPFAAFPLDTALSAVSLIRAGVPQKYPNLRIGFSHGGGAIVPLTYRLGQGHRLTDGFKGKLTRSPAEYAAGFYYDSLVYDGGYLKYLCNEFAPGQIFCGTDYPYAIMETDPAGFLERSGVSDQCAMAAERFLGIEAPE